MDGPNPTESKIARDEGFIIRTRMNTVNGHSDQRDQVRGSLNDPMEVTLRDILNKTVVELEDPV